jgi:ribosomal protein S3
MGQKTNPNIFRLGVNKKWKTEFFEKKSQELSNYTFKDLEIKEFIERFLETRGLLLHDYKLHYSNSVLNIYISYFVTPSFAFEKTSNDNITIIKKSDSQRAVIQSCNKINVRKTISQRVMLATQKASSFPKPSLPIVKFPNRIKKYLKLKHYGPVLAINDNLESNSSKISHKILGDLTESFNGQKDTNLKVNYSRLLTSQNLETSQIGGDFQKLLKGLSLFTNKQYNIITTFQCINKTFNLTLKQTQALKEKFMLLQKFKNVPFFKESIDLLFASVYHKKSANLLAKLIAFQFKTVKRHNFFIAFLKQTLTRFIDSNFSKVKGIKIIVKGRLNGAPRAKHKILTVGSVPVQTIVSNMDYAQSTCHNSNGSYGIKVWILEKS